MLSAAQGLRGAARAQLVDVVTLDPTAATNRSLIDQLAQPRTYREGSPATCLREVLLEDNAPRGSDGGKPRLVRSWPVRCPTGESDRAS